ncbi:phosphotransferase [Streptomyces capparidis]
MPVRDAGIAAGARPIPDSVWLDVLDRARRFGKPVSGYHNRNDVRRLDGSLAHLAEIARDTRVKLRFPLRGTPEVVMRAWRDEAALLRALEPWLPGIPRCLADCGEFTVHTYVPGWRLSRIRPPGWEVPEPHLSQIVELFAAMTRVDVSALPPLPEDWPRDGDCTAFLRRLVRFTEERVHRAARPEFGALFDALGIPEDAVLRFEERLGALTPRRFALLHTDVHRDNLIVRPDGRLVAIDWELAMVGDPLHDLATHLCRMRYPESGSWTARVARRWAAAVPPGAAGGWERDLAVYLDWERAQSVFPDVIRAARGLLDGSSGASLPRRIRKASLRIHRTLALARGPLRLENVLGVRDIRAELTRWLDGRRRGRPRPGGAGAPVAVGPAPGPSDTRAPWVAGGEWRTDPWRAPGRGARAGTAARVTGHGGVGRERAG